MSEEMVERVAIALRESLPKSFIVEDLRSAARAAIGAMREPTCVMLNAGWQTDGWPRQYRAAIDAALSNPSGEDAK